MKPVAHNWMSGYFFFFVFLSAVCTVLLFIFWQIIFLAPLLIYLWLALSCSTSYRIRGQCLEARSIFNSEWKAIVCHYHVESYYRSCVRGIIGHHFFLKSGRKMSLEALNDTVDILLKEFSNSCPHTVNGSTIPGWFQSKLDRSHFRAALLLMGLSVALFVGGCLSSDEEVQIMLPIFGLIFLTIGLLLFISVRKGQRMAKKSRRRMTKKF
jgi:hypothetical protein